MATGLPRELLKWLQSLDLTYSVKNVKRDFSNGFLVAEIFSRYYAQDVEMHSFENGTSLQKKLDNWGQLNKFFVRRGIKIDREIIDDCVHCKNAESPTKLIMQIYTILTRREVKESRRVGDMASSGMDATSALPPFARPNASSVLSTNMKDSEMLTTLQDRTAAQNRAKSLLDDHTSTLRNERTSEPNRFSTSAVGASQASYQNMLRGPAKPVSEAVETAPVRFQEVKVRAVDRKIAQLRAQRDPINGGLSFTGSSPPSIAAGPAGGGMSGAPLPPPVVDVMQLLSDRVMGDPALLDGTKTTPDSAFLALIRLLPDLDEARASAFFGGALADAALMGQACLESPKQAWQLFNMFSQALAAAAGSEAVFGQVAAMLCAVGGKLVAADPKVAQSLLQDFGLPRLLCACEWFSIRRTLGPLITNHPARLRELLRVLYAFSADTPDAHIDTIRWLQESLDDQKHFLHTLTVLITLESGFSDELLDLYVYYCVIALGMPGARLRAAALGMLPFVCQVNYQLVLQMLPRLTMLVEEPWWEVTAGLGKICSMLLASPEAAASEEAPQLLSILLSTLSSRNPMVLREVLPVAATVIATHEAVRVPFAAACIEMSAKDRMMLGQSAFSWPHLPVAEALLAHAKQHNLEHLSPAHAELVMTFLAFANQDASVEREAWQAWLKTNKDYLYVALCHEDQCESIAFGLVSLFMVLQELALPTFSTLFSSLRMLCGPDGHPTCQANADSMLSKLFEMGEPFAGAIAKLIGEMEPFMKSALSTTVSLVQG